MLAARAWPALTPVNDEETPCRDHATETLDLGADQETETMRRVYDGYDDDRLTSDGGS